MNFLSLMEKVEAPYYMFCDQDDVWLPNKIELSIQAMETLQQQYPQTPIIICTDMYVVDQNLSIINNYFTITISSEEMVRLLFFWSSFSSFRFFMTASSAAISASAVSFAA